MPTARQRPRHIACRMASIERPVCFKRTRERRGQAAPTVTGARSWSRRTDKPRKAVRCARATKVDRIRFLFTMSDNPRTLARSRNSLWTLLSQDWAGSRDPASGGARRDRTDDLMLAKHALSQLSYGPEAKLAMVEWWAWEDLNLRPHAYQARALTN